MIVYLNNLTDDTLEHAKRFGARYDGKGRWYAFEPVHSELINYIEKPAYRMKQDDAPACPDCGNSMMLRESKKGHNFWGCSSYPTCKGVLPYDIAPVQVPQNTHHIQPKRLADKQARREFLTYALHVLGSEQALRKWLDVPKVGLNRRTPRQCLHDADALDKMYGILKTLYR